jgi:hypothetical protein
MGAFLKRLGILVFSLAVGFVLGLVGSKQYSYISADHTILTMWLWSQLTYGLGVRVLEIRTTKFRSNLYWGSFTLCVVLFFAHEFVFWPFGLCLFDPCY